MTGNGSDLIDQANDTAELFLQNSMQNRKPTGPAANGVCLYCEEPLQEGQRWCNAECRNSYEEEQYQMEKANAR